MVFVLVRAGFVGSASWSLAVRWFRGGGYDLLRVAEGRVMDVECFDYIFTYPM